MPIDNEYSAKVQQCAQQGQALMRQLTNAGAPETLYLHVRASEVGKPGQLFLARRDAPNPYGYPRVTQEGLPTSLPYDSYFQWVWERARRAPILSLAGDGHSNEQDECQ
ncbi:hypothetical protein [Herbaspirillum huttiense]|uniref:hypothetical protein n=1 Tax=Herbaspirillum huttiense TaxID=863372 RepID=UPI0039B10758